jgi:hypothetical protein
MPFSVHRDAPHILLINPWIHDFAAYDYWAKPLGLLMLGALLRMHGIRISYTDCLNRFHPRAKQNKNRAGDGRGHYLKTLLPKPAGLEDVRRNYSRYGIKTQWFIEDLKSVQRPDLIFVTSMMTYWYPGVLETIRTLRSVFPRTPIILGGIYATLCTEHAEKIMGPDQIVCGSGMHRVLDLVKEYTGYEVLPQFDPGDMNTWPLPVFDLEDRLTAIPLLTSMGCPFRCDYCASGFLNPRHMRRNPDLVKEEIKYWHQEHGVMDFAFYDDALLFNPETHIILLLKEIIDSGIRIRFHTPNALHVREISPEIARLMFLAGFQTIRLGLETARFSEGERVFDQKVRGNEFIRAVNNLKNAGFKGNQIGAYLLAGLPEEPEAMLETSIETVRSMGILPVLAHYTPIPHTQLWEKAALASRYDIKSDPVWTNNAVCPCQKEPFSWEKISGLKRLASKYLGDQALGI